VVGAIGNDSGGPSAGAVYVVTTDPERIAAAAQEAIIAKRPQRRWARKRLQNRLTGELSGFAVRLVDVSYGGFRMELPAGAALSARERFELMVGSLRVAALPVWMKQQSINERLWCGATVSENGESNLAWREFVDNALNQAVQ
jgi:hypothetical protein